MNPAITPSSAVTATETPSHLILVRLTVPPLPGMSPPGNHYATIILHRLLEARIKAAGVTVEPTATYLGEFNQSFYFFRVDTVGKALAAIREALGTVALLHQSQFGWLDEFENMIRLVHPRSDSIPWPDAEITASSAATGAVVAELLKLCQIFHVDPPEDRLL